MFETTNTHGTPDNWKVVIAMVIFKINCAMFCFYDVFGGALEL
jgi:hypothetical protein